MMTIRADMGAHRDYAQFRGAAELLEYQEIDWLEEVKKSSSDVEDPAARVVELQLALREKDRRIAELEAKLSAQTHIFAEAQQEVILSSFRKWDSNGNGRISKEELAETFKALGKHFSDEDLDIIFAELDKNQDGEVNY